MANYLNEDIVSDALCTLCEAAFLIGEIGDAMERPDLAEELGGEISEKDGELCELGGKVTCCIYEAAFVLTGAFGVKAPEMQDTGIDSERLVEDLRDDCGKIGRRLDGIRARLAALTSEGLRTETLNRERVGRGGARLREARSRFSVVS